MTRLDPDEQADLARGFAELIEILEPLHRGRELFTTEEWKKFLIRSIGLEPGVLTPRTQDMALLRMVPFVERNYNMVELGPRGTGTES